MYVVQSLCFLFSVGCRNTHVTVPSVWQWFWRLDSRNIVKDPVHIHKFWYGLPADVTKIDAVLERPGDKRIIFFSGESAAAWRQKEPWSLLGRPASDPASKQFVPLLLFVCMYVVFFLLFLNNWPLYLKGIVRISTSSETITFVS